LWAHQEISTVFGGPIQEPAQHGIPSLIGTWLYLYRTQCGKHG